MVKRLEMQNDGTFKKTEKKRIYPKIIKSIVDKSEFRPNVSDVRNLLTSDKIGSPVTALYDSIDGKMPKYSNYDMTHLTDITETDKVIETLANISAENQKEAIKTGKIELAKIKENAKKAQENLKSNSTGGEKTE